MRRSYVLHTKNIGEVRQVTKIYAKNIWTLLWSVRTQFGQKQLIPHFLDNRLTDGGENASPMRRQRIPPPPPRKTFRYSYLLEAESTPRPQCDWKDYVNWNNPMTSSGIEPATVRIVARCPNLFRTKYKKLKLLCCVIRSRNNSLFRIISILKVDQIHKFTRRSKYLIQFYFDKVFPCRTQNPFFKKFITVISLVTLYKCC
jgi:hypothetical protein